MASRLIVGTRGSPLALAQTRNVIHALQTALPHALEIETRVITTTGDVTLNTPLPEIGGKGLFTAELDAALRDGLIDIAVHSLKDLPVGADLPDAPLVLGAICQRATVQDAVISPEGWQLATLPAGACIGTSSLRRQRQLQRARPDLRVRSIRGNVDTRIGKTRSGEYDAIVLAACGLDRLGLANEITERLALDVMLPAPGQGAVAVQCRQNDATTLAMLAAIDDIETRRAVLAERVFLAQLGGGCSLPVAAWAHSSGDDLVLWGRVCGATQDATIDVCGRGSDWRLLGEVLAQQALRQGARELLQ